MSAQSILIKGVFFLFRHSVLLLFLLNSCGMGTDVVSESPFQKRKYQEGWHLNFGPSDERDPKGKVRDPTRAQNEREHFEQERSPRSSTPDELQAEAGAPLPDKKEDEQEDCDLIIKKDGEEIKANVLTIGVEEVEYKKCDQEEGPTYVISKSEVERIQFREEKGEKKEEAGKKEEKEEEEEEASGPDYYQEGGFEEAEKEEQENEGEKEGENGGSALLGFILSLGAVNIGLIGLSINIWVVVASLAIALLALIFSSSGEGGLGVAGTIISAVYLGVGVSILGLVALVLAL